MNKEEYKEAFTLIDLFANRGCDETDCCNCIACNEKSNQQHGCKLDLALDMFENLIDDYFKLKEKYFKILDDVHDYRFETHCMKMTMRNLCEHFGVKNEKELQNIYLNKPYKLEDLKEGMRVYDIKYDEFCKIDFIAGIYIHRSYSDGTISDSPFEENRFFSTQCNLSHCIREVA